MLNNYGEICVYIRAYFFHLNIEEKCVKKRTQYIEGTNILEDKKLSFLYIPHKCSFFLETLLRT
jgi:hypothetical protein